MAAHTSTQTGIFLTHLRTPRIQGHFQRLVRETEGTVTWHWVYNPGAGARPETSFSYQDPAEVLPHRYAAMVRNGGLYGGFLDTLFVPVLLAIPAEHTWLVEYDVDFAGSWGDLFEQFADNEADLLTTSILYKAQHPDWPHWRTAATPAGVADGDLVRSLNPFMRVSKSLLGAYRTAMADPGWAGTYEFILATVAHLTGLHLEDLGNEGSFTPPERVGRIYRGRSPAGAPDDMTFRFRPPRPRYFHEDPDAFERPDMVYHPIKPGARTRRPGRLTAETRRARLEPDGPDGAADGSSSGSD